MPFTVATANTRTAEAGASGCGFGCVASARNRAANPTMLRLVTFEMHSPNEPAAAGFFVPTRALAAHHQRS